MAAPSPQTKLDAVNMMLEAVWDTPVSALNATGVSSVATAIRILDATQRAVLTRGWAFNTEREYPLALDNDSKIPLPENTLVVDPDGKSAHIDGVQRGSYLYDREEHSFTFTENPVYVRIVFSIDFDDLPEYAKDYIALLAARRFKAYYLSQDEGQPSAAEIEALRNLEDAEAETGDHNILTDNPTSAAVLRR